MRILLWTGRHSNTTYRTHWLAIETVASGHKGNGGKTMTNFRTNLKRHLTSRVKDSPLSTNPLRHSGYAVAYRRTAFPVKDNQHTPALHTASSKQAGSATELRPHLLENSPRSDSESEAAKTSGSWAGIALSPGAPRALGRRAAWPPPGRSSSRRRKKKIAVEPPIHKKQKAGRQTLDSPKAQINYLTPQQSRTHLLVM